MRSVAARRLALVLAFLGLTVAIGVLGGLLVDAVGPVGYFCAFAFNFAVSMAAADAWTRIGDRP
jgi:hypothetical protein